MIHLDSPTFEPPETASWRFNTELLGVLRVQPLPAAKLHGLGADDASNRLTREEPVKDVEGGWDTLLNWVAHPLGFVFQRVRPLNLFFLVREAYSRRAAVFESRCFIFVLQASFLRHISSVNKS